MLKDKLQGNEAGFHHQVAEKPEYGKGGEQMIFESGKPRADGGIEGNDADSKTAFYTCFLSLCQGPGKGSGFAGSRPFYVFLW